MEVQDAGSRRPVGKLGARVYYYRGASYYSRSYFIPQQPGTFLQLFRWLIFRAGVFAWHSMTPAQRAPWKTEGHARRMSGFNAWLSWYLLRF